MPIIPLLCNAQEITVRIDGPKAGGSGVIVKREGNDYTVLTNWHVVDNAGDYEIQTSDGKRHRVNYRQELSGLDLAKLQFSSTQSYRVAELGNSDNVSRNQSVYVSGWLNPLPGINQRSYQFIEGKITSILARPEDGGYALVYNTIGNYKGMSGGPVLNASGQVVGINGRATRDLIDGPVGLYLGIPINRFAGSLTAISPRGGETRREPGEFFCGRYNGVPATVVKHPDRGEVAFIHWVSDYYSASGLTPQRMCEEVSARFQRAQENRTLVFLVPATRNNQPVVCASRSEDGPCEQLLFEVPPGRYAEEIIKTIEQTNSDALVHDLPL